MAGTISSSLMRHELHRQGQLLSSLRERHLMNNLFWTSEALGETENHPGEWRIMKANLMSSGVDISRWNVNDVAFLQPGLNRLDTDLRILSVSTEYELRTRSSWLTRNLEVMSGVIDPDHTGTLSILIRNHNPHPVQIWGDNPVAQLVPRAGMGCYVRPVPVTGNNYRRMINTFAENMDRLFRNERKVRDLRHEDWKRYAQPYHDGDEFWSWRREDAFGSSSLKKRSVPLNIMDLSWALTAGGPKTRQEALSDCMGSAQLEDSGLNSAVSFEEMSPDRGTDFPNGLVINHVEWIDGDHALLVKRQKDRCLDHTAPRAKRAKEGGQKVEIEQRKSGVSYAAMDLPKGEIPGGCAEDAPGSVANRDRWARLQVWHNLLQTRQELNENSRETNAQAQRGFLSLKRAFGEAHAMIKRVDMNPYGWCNTEGL